MLALLSFAALYGAWRIGRAAFEVLRRIPRSNEDLIFF